jgi:hypothetical protein
MVLPVALVSAQPIVEALGGRWHGSYGTARCPAHRDRKPSLSVSDSADGKLLVYCHSGCEQRQVIAALRGLGLWPEAAANRAPLTPAEQEQRRRQHLQREREQVRRAAFVEKAWRKIWATAAPACGSPIAMWLRARDIDPGKLDIDRLPLRWAAHCPLGNGTAPAMVALMSHPITAEPCGVHRTYLTPDGSAKAKVETVRRMLGNAGIIRLSPDEDVAEGLGISEGIETGLSIMAAGWRPIWACGSLGALTAFPVLGGIECLTIFADPKPHEVAGAQLCASRWAKAGREVIVRVPGHGDWNDTLGVAA